MTSTRIAWRCAAVAAALLPLGLISGRPVLVAAAAPFTVAVALALIVPRPSVRISLSTDTAVVHETAELTLTIELTSNRRVACALVSIAGMPDFAPIAVSLPAGRPVVLQRVVTSQRWGRRRFGPAVCSAIGPLAITRVDQLAVSETVSVTVLPRPSTFRAGGATPRDAGFAGEHRAHTAGAGVELSAVRPWIPGDRPQWINWATTSRTGELHVTGTLGDQAARVLVVIDSEHAGTGLGSGVREVAVRAAAGITTHYLDRGDIVGLAEYGGRNRLLPPSSGRRQATIAQNWLLDVGPRSAALPEASRWLTTLPVYGALVIALTPLLDEQAAANLLVLRRRAASVVVIDVVSPRAFQVRTEVQRDRTAWLLWSLERDLLRSRLRAAGVPVVGWRGTGSLDEALREVSRLARSPRAALR